MAAPTIVGSNYETTYSGVNSAVVTITDGFTAGNTVMVGITQEQSTQRTINSVVDSGGANSYSQQFGNNASGTTCGAYGWAATGITAVGAGGTVTVTLSGNSVGGVNVQEISTSTASGLSDTVTNASSLNHTSGATGLTTAGDVLVWCVGSLNGSVATKTAGGTFTILGNATTVRSFFQYRASNTGLTNETGPWSHTTLNRVNAGGMTAFYAAGGAAGQPTIRRFGLAKYVGSLAPKGHEGVAIMQLPRAA